MNQADIVQTAPEDGALEALKDRAALVLEEARRQGADACEVAISRNDGLSATVRLGDIETLEFHRDRGFSVTVWIGQRKGSASSSDDSAQSLRETVAAAMAIARHTGEDPSSGIADASLLASDLPDLDLCHPWPMSVAQAVDLAGRAEAAGRADARIINSEGATVSTGCSLRVYGNSNGFLAGYPGSFHSLSCVLVAGADGAMQRDYWYDGSRVPGRLMAPEDIGERAAARACARLGASRPRTGTVPVMFSPEVASGLLSHFVGAISGGALYRKSSFLLDSLGEPLFPAWCDIHEAPRMPSWNGSAPFDADGLATRDNQFVSAGVLKSYALGLYASRRLSAQPTGNGGGVRNLCISDSGESQQQLLEKMGNGVLVTEVMGQGVNMVTGDYSRGAAGYRVENGEITRPLEEFTIAGNLKDMFAGLQGAGTDVDTRGNVRCGSLLLAPMKVAGD
ncbi:MAG: metalloprotease PmbA [Alcanivoracaceae bacterium]|nr:metalloprotease PmbA [Alcanivoracaceae bacterium]